jgi:hypothetical protein
MPTEATLEEIAADEAICDTQFAATDDDTLAALVAAVEAEINAMKVRYCRCSMNTVNSSNIHQIANDSVILAILRGFAARNPPASAAGLQIAAR